MSILQLLDAVGSKLLQDEQQPAVNTEYDAALSQVN